MEILGFVAFYGILLYTEDNYWRVPQSDCGKGTTEAFLDLQTQCNKSFLDNNEKQRICTVARVRRINFRCSEAKSKNMNVVK